MLPAPARRPTQVRGDHLVEDVGVAPFNWTKWHDARAIHHHIHAAERADRRLEEPSHILPVGDVALDGARAPTRGFDLGDGLLRPGCAAGVADDDREAVARQPPCDSAADTARRACDNCRSCHLHHSFGPGHDAGLR